MSWIKENLFGAALGGITAVAAGGLLYWGLRGSSRVESATERFQSAADEVTSLARAPLYPSDENHDGKSKALSDYRGSLDALQKKFLTFRPEKIADIPPAEFGSKVLDTVGKAKKALDEAAVKYPENFALGFEQYTGKPAEQGATGILTYQLEATGDLVAMLAAARPSAVLNVHRPALPEETRGKWQPGESEVARSLPLELVFRGSEKSARGFLNSLVNSESHFFVVRSMRVMNQVKKGPTAEDAKFEAAKPAATENPFGAALDGDFVLPQAPQEGGEAPAPGTPEPGAPAPGTAPGATPPPADGAGTAPADVIPPTLQPELPPKPRDATQILKQLVGNEEITVCVRLDLLLFRDGLSLPGGNAKP